MSRSDQLGTGLCKALGLDPNRVQRITIDVEPYTSGVTIHYIAPHNGHISKVIGNYTLQRKDET